MLALAATNVVGVVLFGLVYVAAGVRYLSQPAFLACLVLEFLLVTAMWVRVERRHRGLEPIRRFGRGAFALACVLIGVPVVVLMPLFWLEAHLPAEAGLQPFLGPVMALVLIALVLTVLMNVTGGIVVAVLTTFSGRGAKS